MTYEQIVGLEPMPNGTIVHRVNPYTKKGYFERHTDEGVFRMTDNDLIDEIQAIRVKNNRAWMDIMRVAMRHAPKDTKALLREIQGNDLAISELNGRLGQEG